jgi:hypothetical protein
MMQCGFGGGAGTAKIKACQMILNLHGEVVWSSFDHYLLYKMGGWRKNSG